MPWSQMRGTEIISDISQPMPRRGSVRLIRVRGPFEFDPDSTDTLLRTLAIFSPPFSHSLRLTQIICSGDRRQFVRLRVCHESVRPFEHS